jgi:hypothetical protein
MTKRVTALAGALFLVWLFFSPIAALLVLSKLFQDFNFFGLVEGILVVYVVLGIVFYQLAKHFGIVEDSLPEDMIPLREMATIKPDYRSEALKMAVLASPLLLFKPVIIFGAIFPILAGVLGIAIFAVTCAANWYPPFREWAYQHLTITTAQPVVDRYRAKNLLMAINGPAIFVSGFLIISCCAYLFP